MQQKEKRKEREGKRKRRYCHLYLASYANINSKHITYIKRKATTKKFLEVNTGKHLCNIELGKSF